MPDFDGWSWAYSFVRWPAAAVIFALSLHPGRASSSDLWFGPTIDGAGGSRDVDRLFKDPATWAEAAKKISVMSVPVNYLLRAPPGVIHRELAWLEQHRIALNVSVSILPVDKHVCGDGIEGMSWPGEAALMAQRLQDLGVKIASFGLDLPLTDSFFSTDPRACHLTIREAAKRLAEAVGQLRKFYPHAGIYDTEVPTGKPISEWLKALSEWLLDYRLASGSDFDGVILDVWWLSPWRDVALDSLRLLRDRHIQSGIILNADFKSDTPAATWAISARSNSCAVRALGFRILVIENWLDLQVRDIPENDPDTLTGLLDWFDSARSCLN